MSILSALRSFFSRSAPDGAPERLPSPDALVLLTRPHGEPEARMLQGILEDNGIHSLLKNRDAVGVDGGGWGAPWKYELWVLRKELRRARELLEIGDEDAGAT
jgi:hypothetical protein